MRRMSMRANSTPGPRSAPNLRRRIAVGTALASGPPHRSQRAELPHWAPASDSGVEPHVRKGMPLAGGR